MPNMLLYPFSHHHSNIFLTCTSVQYDIKLQVFFSFFSTFSFDNNEAAFLVCMFKKTLESVPPDSVIPLPYCYTTVNLLGFLFNISQYLHK